ncbi:MAG: hypothetical protein ACFCAD_27075, partial [Pleurocapsa sp.]
DICRDCGLCMDVLGVTDLAEIGDRSVKNNGNNTASIITGANGQQVAVLFGMTEITVSDLDFVEV